MSSKQSSGWPKYDWDVASITYGMPLSFFMCITSCTVFADFFGIVLEYPVILCLQSAKGGKQHDESQWMCKQKHWVHCDPVQKPLRNRKLLCTGQNQGWHPWVQSHHGSVHRLLVFPEEVRNPTKKIIRIGRLGIGIYRFWPVLFRLYFVKKWPQAPACGHFLYSSNPKNPTLKTAIGTCKGW